ncbi:germ cell-specific gene 1 protein [Danio rerio]|uniref:Germ cell-specific gene 1 protein n=1 Tax=Danio rerio TaxID=7955 RepID=A0AC58IZW9_DANRE
MSVVSVLRSPRLSLLQTLVSLLLSLLSLSSSHWCVGLQKVPKPLCSASRRLRCTPVHGGVSDGSFSWETGDDRFIFPSFHSGLWSTCEENIYTDAWEEKCRSFMALTPASEKGIVWLYVGMELLYISLLSVSSLLLLLQVCVSSYCPALQRWGHLLNAFAAICTVLGGLVGMVAHMMYMQVFQVTITLGPEDFKPHSYGYSWAFYVAWVAFTCCMSSGVSTLNTYTKTFLMAKNRSVFYPCRNFTFPPQPPPLSPLSPYFCPPLPPTCSAPLSPGTAHRSTGHTLLSTCPAPLSPSSPALSPSHTLLLPNPAPFSNKFSSCPSPFSHSSSLLSPCSAPLPNSPTLLSPISLLVRPSTPPISGPLSLLAPPPSPPISLVLSSLSSPGSDEEFSPL